MCASGLDSPRIVRARRGRRRSSAALDLSAGGDVGALAMTSVMTTALAAMTSRGGGHGSDFERWPAMTRAASPPGDDLERWWRVHRLAMSRPGNGSRPPGIVFGLDFARQESLGPSTTP